MVKGEVHRPRSSVKMDARKLLFYIVCLFLVVLSNFDVTLGDDDKSVNAKKKLQIGVKKRVDNCQVKSKKGDFLHMHYKVRLNRYSMVFQMRLVTICVQ